MAGAASLAVCGAARVSWRRAAGDRAGIRGNGVAKGRAVVGGGGFEPPTPAMSTQCSPAELRAPKGKDADETSVRYNLIIIRISPLTPRNPP